MLATSFAIRLFSVLAVVFLFGCQATTKRNTASPKNDPKQILVRPPDRNYHPIAVIENGSISPQLDGVWQYGLLAATAYDAGTNHSTITGLCLYPSRYLPRWKRVAGYSEGLVFPAKPSGRLTVPGLSYSVWEDTGSSGRARLALTFRGTDSGDWGDWYSNARWITRLNPATWDQYQQTHDLVTLVVPMLKKQFGPDVEIISVGHSLGGGLAQHAAYSSPDISTVFAFASSPVTGYRSLDPNENRNNRNGLQIFRINESGEVLANARWFRRKLGPLSTKNPTVYEIRFSFRQAFYKPGSRGDGLVSQHGIRQLSCDLICHVERGLPNETCLKTASVDP
jgi:hypothetical protein